MPDQPTARPTAKVTAATAGAAVGPVVLGLAVWMGAADPPVMLEGGLSTLGAFAFGYWARERDSDQ